MGGGDPIKTVIIELLEKLIKNCSYEVGKSAFIW